jgi:hypothetical protein
MGHNMHDFRFSESDILRERQADGRMRLKRLRKFVVRRGRFCPLLGVSRDAIARKSIKLICPSGKRAAAPRVIASEAKQSRNASGLWIASSPSAKLLCNFVAGSSQ